MITESGDLYNQENNKMKFILNFCILLLILYCNKDDNNKITSENSSPTVKLNTTYEVNITEDIGFINLFFKS